MRLTDILKESHVLMPLKSDERDDAIRALIDILDQNQLLSDKEKAFQAVLEREKIMTTGVGNGIAIPHCKDSSCPNFAVALGLHPKGVDFHSLDKKKAKIVFLLVGPENNPGMHIKLLSRISRLMSNEELREQIISCKKPEEVIEIIQEEEEYYFDLD
ncbi:MAG TPA: PTS sugar transporter subunit IIA [Caldithrix abyssi]|uniref:PTS sugar transporter subunit IIA n=1 Tax=Caldithrix abyssi TaxID=187145 RepID=A0A7V4U0C0_CALAY|nr:PTS sugar transporter subunit IIA [Caldithrix abyssi]